MKNFVCQPKRLGEVVLVWIYFYYRAFIKLRDTNDSSLSKKRAVLLRLSFEKLGSVFIKFGQFLSLRPDLLPSPYCRELFYLLENVPSFSYEEVLKTIKREFRITPDKLFKTFNPKPIAAASFGQVHEAYLNTGEKVAVKIRRPQIEELVKKDISLIKILGSIIDIFLPGPNKILSSIEEFEQWTKEELNYEEEASHTETFRQLNKNREEDIVVPRVFRKYCSPSVITVDFIEGITLSNILLAMRRGDKKLLSKIKKQDFSPKRISEMLLKNSVQQIYQEGLFHADPHPANIIFMGGTKLGYIDFGIVGELDKKMRFICLRYTRSVFYGDTENAFDALAKLLDISKVKDLNSFKKEHDAIIKETLLDFEKGRAGGNPHIIGRIFFAKLKLLQKYHARIPMNTLRYFRALSTLEGIILELYPQMELQEIARKFRNISIVNMIRELPDFFSLENMDENLIKWLNIIEKEMFGRIDPEQ